MANMEKLERYELVPGEMTPAKFNELKGAYGKDGIAIGVVAASIDILVDLYDSTKGPIPEGYATKWEWFQAILRQDKGTPLNPLAQTMREKFGWGLENPLIESDWRQAARLYINLPTISPKQKEEWLRAWEEYHSSTIVQLDHLYLQFQGGSGLLMPEAQVVTSSAPMQRYSTIPLIAKLDTGERFGYGGTIVHPDRLRASSGLWQNCTWRKGGPIMNGLDPEDAPNGSIHHGI